MNAKKRSAKKRSSRKMKSLKKKSSAKKRSAKKRLSKKIKYLKRNSSVKKRSTKKRSSRKIKSLKKYQKKSLTKNFRGGGKKLLEYARSNNPVKKAIVNLRILLAKTIKEGKKKENERRKEIEEKIDTIINEKKGHLEKANINIGLLKYHLLNQFLLGQDAKLNYIRINTKILDKALDKLINEVKDANKELDKLEYKDIVEKLINYMRSGIKRSSLKFTTNKKRDSLLDDMSRRQSKRPSLRKSLFELRKNSESKQNDTQSRKNSERWKSLIQEYNQKLPKQRKTETVKTRNSFTDIDVDKALDLFFSEIDINSLKI